MLAKDDLPLPVNPATSHCRDPVERSSNSEDQGAPLSSRWLKAKFFIKSGLFLAENESGTP